MANSIKKKKVVDDDSASAIRELLYKYLPYWPIFIIFVLVMLFAGWLYVHTTVPQYEVTASLMLKDEKKGTQDGQTLNSLNQLSEKKIVENEIEVIHSRTIMNEVVKNLKLYASFYEENKLVAKPAYSSSPIKIEVADPEKITEFSKVKFTFSDKDSTVSIGSKWYPLNKMVSTPYGNLKFIANKSQTHKASKPLYFDLTPTKIVANDIIGNLQTSPTTKLTSVLVLSLTSPDQRRGEDILNELIKVYDKATLDEKNRLAANTSSFVDERLKIVEQELKDIEKDAQSYKSRTGAVDISTQGQLFLQSVSTNDQQLSDINMQLAVLEEVEKDVVSNNNKGSIIPSTLGLKDPKLPEMLTKLNDLELTYEKQKKTIGENNPMLLSIKDQINKIRPGLLENIKSQRTSLERSKLNIASTNNNLSSMLQSIPLKEKDLIDISRQQSIKSAQYSFLLQKKEESDLSHASNISETRVIDKAESSFFPVSPNGRKIYSIAFLIGLALPIGFISIKELLNRKILFRNEIEKLTNVPIIGEISFDKSKDPFVIQEGKRTFTAEQFRRMRASLGYLGGNSGKKKILVTSSLSGEGKSFVALNLALSLALTDKKVVLLELDMVNPSLGKKMDTHYEEGVSNYLMNEKEPEEIIKRTSVNKNLFFIPAGSLPENPSELLLTDRLKELLSYLEDIFDVIIIDSAPASLLSDAYVLSPLCDVTLYVVKHKFTPKSYIQRLDEENYSGNQLTNMRIVFNGIRSRGFTKNGYGYGYGYGYIHNDTKKLKKKLS